MKENTRYFKLPKAPCYSTWVMILLFLPILSFGQIFYGMTYEGGDPFKQGGCIFRFNPSTNNEQKVWNFQQAHTFDGANPIGALVYDSSRKIFFGMTGVGGRSFNGTIITYDPALKQENVAWNFKNTPGDGAGPWGETIYSDTLKQYFALTGSGGANGLGAIISFDPVKDTDLLLWSFGGGTDGQYPFSDMTYDAANKVFYGVTTRGGSATYGTIFSFDPFTNQEQVLYNFGLTLNDGQIPEGRLVYNAGQGLYYGVTGQGGDSGLGTIYSFNPGTNAVKVVWSFQGHNDGEDPLGSLVYDSAQGLYYGTADYGGMGYEGIIFSFDPVKDTEKVVWNFGVVANDGVSPYYQTPVWDPLNNLFYGMTHFGGDMDEGVIYSFDPVKDTEVVVWNFGHGSDGAIPYGDLTYYDTTQEITGYAQVAAATGLVSVYPNPNNGKFNMILSNQLVAGTNNGYSKHFSIQVYNVMGEIVYTSLLQADKNEINLESRAQGIYFYRVVGQDGGFVEDGKIVIQR